MLKKSNTAKKHYKSYFYIKIRKKAEKSNRLCNRLTKSIR